jgi:hypothetical protein
MTVYTIGYEGLDIDALPIRNTRPYLQQDCLPIHPSVSL